MLIIGACEDPAEDEQVRVWVRATLAKMSDFTADRVYVNYLGTQADEGENRLAAAYGEGKFDRLVALKRKYDPTNLFRLNQNVSPD